MNPKYIKPGLDQAMARFTEEAGEVLAALGKTQRFGLDSVNPELPKEKQVSNRKWLLDELNDLEDALIKLRTAICHEYDKSKEFKVGDIVRLKMDDDSKEDLVKGRLYEVSEVSYSKMFGHYVQLKGLYSSYLFCQVEKVDIPV